MSDVSVPAELVEALRRSLHSKGYSPIYVAARALVDAVERPTEDECPECKHPKTDHHWVKGGDRWACRGDCLCDIGFDRPAPAAPPSEPLCRCGHDGAMHLLAVPRLSGLTPCLVMGCEGCETFTPSSISDEAEAPSGWWMVSAVSETDGWIEVWDDSDDRGPRALFRDADDAEFVVAAVRAACQEEA